MISAIFGEMAEIVPMRCGDRIDATAAAALSLGVGSAYAGDGDGPVANTQFTELPRVVAQAPVQNAPAVATARNGQAIGTYVTHSDSASPFLLNNFK